MQIPDGLRRSAWYRVAALAALALAGAPRAGAAQDGSFTLDGVVRLALERSPQLRIVRARLDGARGRALASGGRFDLQVGSSVEGERQSAYQLGQSGLVTANSRTTTYSLQAGRRLRSGITLSPRLSVSRTAQEGVDVADAGSLVALDVGVPVLRDRFGRGSAAPERALRLSATAGEHDLRHAAAGVVSHAAGAYWDYAAAHARLEVYARAEERAERRLEETRALVGGDERPAADLVPLEAAIARARQQRITAEQAVTEARAELGTALGMELPAVAALPPPTTPFPAAEPWAPDAAEEARLVRLGLDRRGDLAATRIELRSGSVLLEGAREELKPRLDLHLSVGYAGRRIGTGYGVLVEPLYRDLPGLNAGVRVEYQLPLVRTEARGRVAESEAARAERALQVEDLARRVATGVSVAVQALRRNAAVVAEAERAVELYGASVEHEQQKNRLGAATLFDVTYAEDALTSAMLSVVAGRVAYARALAQLRYETGTLSHDAGGTPAVDPAALLTRP